MYAAGATSALSCYKLLRGLSGQTTHSTALCGDSPWHPPEGSGLTKCSASQLSLCELRIAEAKCHKAPSYTCWRGAALLPTAPPHCTI